ncbi:hypothetical protein [Enterobacter asburiae]
MEKSIYNNLIDDFRERFFAFLLMADCFFFAQVVLVTGKPDVVMLQASG